MAYDNQFMIGHALYYSGRPLTIRQIVGAVRAVFAVTLTRRAVRRTCFETAAASPRTSGRVNLIPSPEGEGVPHPRKRP